MKKTFEIKGVDLTELYGIGDQNILFLEKSLPLNINIRGNSLFCKGLKKDLDHFSVILGHMVDSIKKGNNLTTKDINQLLAMNMQQTLDRKKSIGNVVFYGKKGPVHARTDGQKELLNSLFKNDIVISVGPAGTGKTFLAVAYALNDTVSLSGKTDQAAGAESVQTIGASTTLNGVSVSVESANNSTWDVDLGYTAGGFALTYGVDETDGWTATASAALGGGATFNAGVNDEDSMYAGVSFAF